MTDHDLTLGLYRYEHTEPLFDGRVAIDGVDARITTSPLISDIFQHRNFRHEALFVNTDAGIERPEDLAGKTVGELALRGHDPGV